MDRSPRDTMPSRHTWNAASTQPVRTVDAERFDAMFEGMGSALPTQHPSLYSSQRAVPNHQLRNVINGRSLYSTHDGVIDGNEEYLHPDTMQPMNPPPPTTSIRSSARFSDNMVPVSEIPDGRSWPMGMILGNGGEILR
eukprot:743356-Rhodomonas_salina.1